MTDTREVARRIRAMLIKDFHPQRSVNEDDMDNAIAAELDKEQAGDVPAHHAFETDADFQDETGKLYEEWRSRSEATEDFDEWKVAEIIRLRRVVTGLDSALCMSNKGWQEEGKKFDVQASSTGDLVEALRTLPRYSIGYRVSECFPDQEQAVMEMDGRGRWVAMSDVELAIKKAEAALLAAQKEKAL